jgi:single-stranded-DNA-specific exonuclease
LRYELIGNNDTSNIIQTVLQNRGIEDWKEYLNLNSVDPDEYLGLDNIDTAVECFASHVEKGSEVGILFDTDTDGICSGTIMYKYIKSVAPECKVHIITHRREKAHGLVAKDFEIPENVKLLIVPDSSTNDIDECQELLDAGTQIIITDHHTHSCGRENPAILINNQTSDNYVNKDACGAHITYDFCKALDAYYWTDYADDLIDLVALADIADVMSIKSFPTRAAINVGFTNIKNKMFAEILKAQEFSTKGLVSPFTVSFYVSPLINAFLRTATFEERILLARAFCEDESETFWYTKRGEDFPTEENIYEHVVRLAKSYKGKQDRLKKKAIPELIKLAGKTDDKVAVIDATGVLDTALTGVVAIKVSEELNVPVLMLQRRGDNEAEYGGSGRAFDNCAVDDFRALVESCPYTTFAQGHNSAFGLSIPVNNIDLVRQWLNEQLADISMEKVYSVDFELDADELETHMFQTLDYHRSLWGHGVQEPLFVIKNLHISTDNARICGKKQDTIQIYDEMADVKYVMFFCKEDNKLHRWLSNNWGDQEADITIVGTLGLSMYEGRLDKQVIIKDVQIFNTIQN